MIRYRALQNQRTRLALNQAAMKRSHRRCDLIRTASDDETVPPSLPATNGEEVREPEALVPSLS